MPQPIKILCKATIIVFFLSLSINEIKGQTKYTFVGKWDWEGSNIPIGFNSGTAEIFKDSLHICYDGNPTIFSATWVKIKNDTLFYQFNNGVYDILTCLKHKNKNKLVGNTSWYGGESPLVFIRRKN